MSKIVLSPAGTVGTVLVLVIDSALPITPRRADYEHENSDLTMICGIVTNGNVLGDIQQLDRVAMVNGGSCYCRESQIVQRNLRFNEQAGHQKFITQFNLVSFRSLSATRILPSLSLMAAMAESGFQ